MLVYYILNINRCLLALLWHFVVNEKSTEAGGLVTDAAGNALDFSRGRYLDLHEGIIVTNQRLMPSLLKAVQEALQQTATSTLWFFLLSILFILFSALNPFLSQVWLSFFRRTNLRIINKSFCFWVMPSLYDHNGGLTYAN